MCTEIFIPNETLIWTVCLLDDRDGHNILLSFIALLWLYDKWHLVLPEWMFENLSDSSTPLSITLCSAGYSRVLIRTCNGLEVRDTAAAQYSNNQLYPPPDGAPPTRGRQTGFGREVLKEHGLCYPTVSPSTPRPPTTGEKLTAGATDGTVGSPRGYKCPPLVH